MKGSTKTIKACLKAETKGKVVAQKPMRIQICNSESIKSKPPRTMTMKLDAKEPTMISDPFSEMFYSESIESCPIVEYRLQVSG